MSSYTIFHSTNVSMLILPFGKLCTTGIFSSGSSDFCKYIMSMAKLGSTASLYSARALWVKTCFLYEELIDFLHAEIKQDSSILKSALISYS